MQRAEKNSPSLAILDLDQTIFPLLEWQLPLYQAYLKTSYGLLSDAMTPLMKQAIDEENTSRPGRIKRVFFKATDGYQILGNPQLTVPPDVFEPIRNQIRNSPQHATLEPFPNAVDGVNFLLDFYPNHQFITARPKSQEMTSLTIQSLKRIGISDGSNVEVVETPVEKLQRGIDMWKEKQNTDKYHGHVVFIDDGVEALYAAAVKLSDKPAYAQIFADDRVHLVAFGWHSDEREIQGIINPQAHIHVTTMPTWNLQDITKALANVSSISPRES